MVALFVLGAFIGSGIVFSLDLVAQNKILQEKVDKYEKKELPHNE